MHIVLICILALIGVLELAVQYEDDHIPVWEPPCSYVSPVDDPVDDLP